MEGLMIDEIQKLPAQFDAYHESYNAKVNEALSFIGLKVGFFTRVKTSYLVEILGKAFGDTATLAVLDIGCGIGNYHSELSRHIARLTAVDVSSECLQIAREANRNVEYQFFDGCTLPFAEQRFDAAFSINVFHHVPPSDRQILLNSIHRCLRTGGLFVLFEHNPLNPLTMHVVNNCEFDRDAILLTRQDAERLLVGSGFHDVSTRFILTIPAAGRFSRYVDRTFARVPFGAQYYTTARIGPESVK
jgi:SAM-dependent methyltransferase